MFVAISSFKVANDMSDQVEQAFNERSGLVDTFDGFIRLDIIRGITDTNVFRLITYWRDEDCYQKWHRSDAHKISHQGIPTGLKLEQGSFSLEFFRHVSS